MSTSPRRTRRPAEIGLAAVAAVAVVGVAVGAVASRSSSAGDVVVAAGDRSPNLVVPVTGAESASQPSAPPAPTPTSTPETSTSTTATTVPTPSVSTRVLAGSASSTADSWEFLVARPATDRDGVDHRIEIDTAATRQTWEGVGAALTDSSAALLTAHPDAVVRLFAEPADGGAGLDLVRLPLSATDFSLTDWTWQPTDDGTAIPSPEAEASLAVLDSIELVRPGLGVVGAAWTSPASFRTQPDQRGGVLRDDSVAAYADLLADQVSVLTDRGIDLRAVSVGNEPGHVGDYPTLGMTDDQMLAIAERIAPALDAHGVDLLALDHNWSDAERAAGLLRRGAFDGAAFHCYDGDPASMALVNRPIITECTATTGGWRTSVGWMARQLVGEAVRAGSTGLLTWNLALDPQHGPKAPGGCEECRGLLTVDPSAGTAQATPEYAVMRHLSAAADPDADVVETPTIDGLPLAAFANTDGTVGVFGHNDTEEPLLVEVVVDGAAQRFEIEPWSVFSLRG
ncbi:hypothetical protein [Ilumatobacter fluminis]|uniref:hypothetical protein n=1 Tax=Ilumatobacter fluminis TaxID=467091 RepID=UPI00105F00A5|nr:hypothetical protein [Ilumatobacter fluminis]